MLMISLTDLKLVLGLQQGSDIKLHLDFHIGNLWSILGISPNKIT